MRWGRLTGAVAGPGTSDVAVSQMLSGLTPGSPLYFRLVAENTWARPWGPSSRRRRVEVPGGRRCWPTATGDGCATVVIPHRRPGSDNDRAQGPSSECREDHAGDAGENMQLYRPASRWRPGDVPVTFSAKSSSGHDGGLCAQALHRTRTTV